MKILSRDFTRVEKLLIALLALILVGLAYYQFVYKTTTTAIANAETEATELRSELDVAEARLTQLQALQDKMDALQADGDLSYMSSYNNAEAEVAFLNDILATTISYTVSFASIARSGDQIRRSFSLNYNTPDYESAQEILQRLCDSENRCLVSDVSCSIARDGSVSMSQTATFYETMVGGAADAALPRDAAAANS
ncbi:MAG: hypothetical protein IJ089_11850 [Clostridia bacterium]|nr:hypothetical protein [Clostridia bacterium]